MKINPRTFITVILIVVMLVAGGVWANTSQNTSTGPELVPVSGGPLEPTRGVSGDIDATLTIISFRNGADDRVSENLGFPRYANWEVEFEVRNNSMQPLRLDANQFRLYTTHASPAPINLHITFPDSMTTPPLTDAQWLVPGTAQQFNVVYAVAPDSAPRWFAWKPERGLQQMIDLGLV